MIYTNKNTDKSVKFRFLLKFHHHMVKIQPFMHEISNPNYGRF